MDLKCKRCGNVYEMGVSGVGKGFIGLVGVAWKCNVCGRWNFYAKDVIDDVEVSV